MVKQLSEDNLKDVWHLIMESELFVDQKDFEIAFRHQKSLFLVSNQGGVAIAVPFPYLKEAAIIKKIIALPIDENQLIEEIIRRTIDLGFKELISPLLKNENENKFLIYGFKPFKKIYSYRWKAINLQPPTAAMSIRKAGESDIEEIIEIDRKIFDRFWWFRPKQLNYFFKTGEIFLALSDSKIIGYNICREHQGIGNIIRLGVDKDYRRLGVAKYLIWQSLILFLGRGLSEVYLSTQEENVAAQRLYQKTGFHKLPGYVSYLKLNLKKDYDFKKK